MFEPYLLIYKPQTTYQRKSYPSNPTLLSPLLLPPTRLIKDNPNTALVVDDSCGGELVASLSQNPQFPASLFLLFSAPSADHSVHTHDCRAFQFRPSTSSFDPKSIDVVNIGSAFRGHYDSFCPNSPFPLLPYDPINEDEDSLNRMRRLSEDQKQLNMCAQGFDIGSFSRLMGSEAARYTAGLEDLYEKMLAKVQILSTQVEHSSAKVLEQENHNRKLRHNVADL